MQQIFHDMGVNIDTVTAQINAMNEAAARNPLDVQYEGFRKSLKPADDLNTELERLARAFSIQDIVSVYADQIIRAAEAQKQHGYAVDGMVATLLDAAKAYIDAENGVHAVVKRTGSAPMPQTGLAQSASQLFLNTVNKLSDIVNAGASGGQDVLDAIRNILKPAISPQTIAHVVKTPFEAAADVFASAADLFAETVNSLVPALSRIEPAVAGAGADVDLNFTINQEIHIDGDDLGDPIAVRQKLMPQFDDVMRVGLHGYRDRLREYLGITKR